MSEREVIHKLTQNIRDWEDEIGFGTVGVLASIDRLVDEQQKKIDKIKQHRDELIDNLVFIFADVKPHGRRYVTAEKLVEKITGQTWEQIKAGKNESNL